MEETQTTPPATSPRGAPRGRGPPRGGPRGRGPPRGGPRGGPRGRGPPRGRGGPPRGRGAPPSSNQVNALGLESHVKVAADSGIRSVSAQELATTHVDKPAIEKTVTTASGKRHSKIDLKGSGSLSTKGLDVEGLESGTKKTSEVSVSTPQKSGGLAERWKMQMAQQKEDDFQKNRDKLRGRRRGGVEFMDKQIRALIDEIKRISGGSGGGLGAVTFGVLFDETSDTMPALSATLAVAKKRNVISFDGDMLMQGVHSNVKITLLRDEIEDTPDFKSIIGARPIKPTDEDPVFGNSACTVCSKTVYPLDRVCANEKVMHKNCFRCCECQTQLKLANFAYNNGKFFCETHYQQKYRQGTSYNF